MVGALSLALLPGTARAQLRLPDSQQPMMVRPAAPAASPLFRPALPSPYLGAPGGFTGGGRTYGSPFMPGYGGGGYEGNLLNRNGADFNSLFRRSPNELDGNNQLLAPNPYRNLSMPNYSPYRPSNLSQAPNVPSGTTHYGTRAASPTGNYNVTYDGSAPATAVRSYPSAGGVAAYQYDNSHRLHHLAGPGWEIYFPHSVAYYPNYNANYAYGLTAASPYYYYATFPPYIGADSIYSEPPQYDYVPYPVYTQDGQYSGERPDDVENYYLNQNPPSQSQPNQNPATQNSDAAPKQPQESQGSYRIGETTARKDTVIDGAVSDLNAAWQNGDVQALSKHIRQKARIAVYLRGKYQYSLDAGDYLDMTRDAFHATKTVSFKLDNVERKENGVYTVSGHHTYTDQKGKDHTVLVSYVLEKTGDEYYITQVGTSPEKLEE
jgi:hypothetical protein